MRCGLPPSEWLQVKIGIVLDLEARQSLPISHTVQHVLHCKSNQSVSNCSAGTVETIPDAGLTVSPAEGRDVFGLVALAGGSNGQ